MVGRAIRQVVRVVAKSGIAIQNAVVIKPRWPNAKASFEVVLHTDDYRRNMPPVARQVLIGGAMPGPSGEPSRLISKWVVPDRYYVSFPHGVHSVRSLRKHRKAISDKKKKFYISHKGKTVRDGEYLSFTFDVEDWKKFRRTIREGTGRYEPGSYFDKEENTVKGEKLPLDERYSAKYFSLEKVFGQIDIDEQTIVETERYFNIDNWEGYAEYMGSEYAKYVIRPKMILKYHEHNPFGEDRIEEV